MADLDLAKIIAAHESVTVENGCACGRWRWDDGTGTHARHVAHEIRQTFAVVTVPTVHHKGPFDTDASVLMAAADRIKAGFVPGGSNTASAVARLLWDVALQAGDRA